MKHKYEGIAPWQAGQLWRVREGRVGPDRVGPGRVRTGRDVSVLSDLASQQLSLQKFKIKSLSELIGAFKSKASKEIRENGMKEFSWHRSFHDRIIRNAWEFENIRNYIIENPAKFKSPLSS